LETRQGPTLDGQGQGQSAQEVAEVENLEACTPQKGRAP
jgi:uncharacterized protein YciI